MPPVRESFFILKVEIVFIDEGGREGMVDNKVMMTLKVLLLLLLMMIIILKIIIVVIMVTII